MSFGDGLSIEDTDVDNCLCTSSTGYCIILFLALIKCFICNDLVANPNWSPLHYITIRICDTELAI